MADTADLKSADPKGSCGFESHLRHQPFPIGDNGHSETAAGVRVTFE